MDFSNHDLEDEEDEEYEAEKRRKRRNFFDDAPSQDTRGTFGDSGGKGPSFESKMAALGLGDEYVETVDWSGNVTKKSSVPSQSKPVRPANPPVQSARGTVNSSRLAPSPQETASLSNGGVRYSKSSMKEEDNLSIGSNSSLKAKGPSVPPEMTHRRSSSATISEKGSSAVSPAPSLPSADSASSIEDAVRRESKPTIAEIAKLQSEINSLQRKIKSMNKSRFKPLTIAETVILMIEGEPYSLENYRALKDKLDLLDAAIGYHDGNAILSVVMFMKRTLSKELFCREMRIRPVAISQYISFLRMQRSENVASEMRDLGRSEEAAIWKFKQAKEVNEPRQRLKALMDIQDTWFSLNRTMEVETQMIKEYITLLNKQIHIDPIDARAQQEGHPRFRERPRKVSLYFQPLITTLFYCCLYHYHEQENPMSPETFRKDFPLTEKQFLFTALRARSLVKNWDDLERLLTSKNWRGKAKLKSAVRFEHVVEILATAHAPEEQMIKYCRLIDDSDTRLQVARKYKCHVVVIDTLVNMKDRLALEGYKTEVYNTSAENHLELVLRNPNNKWKN